MAQIDGDVARIETQGTRLVAQGAAGRSMGETVHLVVRPEAISVIEGKPADAEATEDANRLSGTLVREVFTGERVLLYVALADGTELIASRASTAQAPSGPAGAGCPVTLEWAASATRIVA